MDTPLTTSAYTAFADWPSLRWVAKPENEYLPESSSLLDPNTFITAGQAQARANDWMWTYNNFRPHESLNNLPPTTFMLKYGKLHPHPLGQTEFPTFQHDNNKNLIENYTFELS